MEIILPNRAGVYDTVGSGAVHMMGGVAAFMGAWIAGEQLHRLPAPNPNPDPIVVLLPPLQPTHSQALFGWHIACHMPLIPTDCRMTFLASE